MVVAPREEPSQGGLRTITSRPPTKLLKGRKSGAYLIGVTTKAHEFWMGLQQRIEALSQISE